MSFLPVLKTIGTDIEKGIAVAAPIVGAFNPAAGPILSEVSQIILALEAQGSSTTLTPEQISTVIQQVSAAQAIKQSLGVSTGASTSSGK